MKQSGFWLLLILFLPFYLSAQDLDDFYTEQDWRTGQIAVSHTTFSGKWEKNPPEQNANNSVVFNPFTFKNSLWYVDANFTVARNFKEQWALNYDFDYPLLSDLQLMLFAIIADMRGKINKDNTGEGILTGWLLGWHNVGVTVLGSDRLAIRTGVSISDYFYSFDYLKPAKYTDPSSGAYFTLGQYATVDFAVMKWLMARARYQIGYWSYLSYHISDSWTSASNYQWDWGKRDDGVKKPIFSALSFELQTLPGIFLHTDLWSAFGGQGADVLSRQTVELGFRFHVFSVGEQISRSMK